MQIHKTLNTEYLCGYHKSFNNINDFFLNSKYNTIVRESCNVCANNYTAANYVSTFPNNCVDLSHKAPDCSNRFFSAIISSFGLINLQRDLINLKQCTKGFVIDKKFDKYK